MSDNKPASGSLSIQEKIQKAEDIFAAQGSALGTNPRIRSLLETLDRQIAASQKAMIDYDVVAACRHCEEEEGGSCCGAGIENRYTPVLLVANLLMGVALPGKRLTAAGCYFLGNRGCSLKVRDVLCVNYLCLKIQNMLPQQDLIRLQNTTGNELDTAFVLHEAIKKCMEK